MAEKKRSDRDAAAPKKRDQSATGRRRSRYALERGDGKLPRIVVLGAFTVLVGAAILNGNWSCENDSVPEGIGEKLTIVSLNDSTAAATTQPRSGEVEIAEQRRDLVPESQSHRSTTQPAAEPVAQPAAKPVAEPAAEPEAKPVVKTDPELVAERVKPAPNGPWAVQVGAFGSETNAQALLTKLQAAEYPATLRAGSTSGGAMVFRVWIGYFASRTDAETFAQQNRQDLGDAIAIHR